MAWRANEHLKRLRRDQRGTSAIEYVLLAAGIGVTVMVLINFFAQQIVSVQTSITAAIQTTGSD